MIEKIKKIEVEKEIVHNNFNEQKDEFIQLIRGLCIISVVIIHSLIFIENNDKINHFKICIRTLVNFGVAIFLFISGYLNNLDKIENNSKKYIVSRVKRLYFPFIIWSIIYSIKC